MNKDRDWTVLLVGGASGIGKSSLAYEIAHFYGVNVLEVDDIQLSVKTATTEKEFPAVHYWETGIDWKTVGIERNVEWLIDVSKEMAPVLKALVDRHIEDRLPVIIEGDFIDPELVLSFENPEVRSIFLQESDKEQIIQNYLSREGGGLQQYRAEISIAYGNWIADICKQKGICLMEARPWDTGLCRSVTKISI